MKNRVFISLICWLTSAYGIYLSIQQIALTIRLTIIDSSRFTPFYSLIFLGFPWIALAIMNVAWIRNRRAHWVWVALGTITGSCGVLLSFGLGALFAPLAIVLAVFLTYFHLLGETTQEQCATKDR